MKIISPVTTRDDGHGYQCTKVGRVGTGQPLLMEGSAIWKPGWANMGKPKIFRRNKRLPTLAWNPTGAPVVWHSDIDTFTRGSSWSSRYVSRDASSAVLSCTAVMTWWSPSSSQQSCWLVCYKRPLQALLSSCLRGAAVWASDFRWSSLGWVRFPAGSNQGTYINSAFHPSEVGKSSTSLTGWG